MTTKTPEAIRSEKPENNDAGETRPAGYRKPQLVQVGTLGDVRAKGGSDGDHDYGYYFGRFRR